MRTLRVAGTEVPLSFSLTLGRHLWSPEPHSGGSEFQNLDLFSQKYPKTLDKSHIALHLQTQRHAKYVSLALYCLIEGGDYIVDETEVQ